MPINIVTAVKQDTTQCFYGLCFLTSYNLFFSFRPSVLDNFALLSGQLNTINKLLKNEKTPSFRNQVIIPLLLSPDRDEDLAVSIKATEWCVCLTEIVLDQSHWLLSACSAHPLTETHRAACASVQPWDRSRLLENKAWPRGGGAGEAAECRSSTDWPRRGTGQWHTSFVGLSWVSTQKSFLIHWLEEYRMSH